MPINASVQSTPARQVSPSSIWTRELLRDVLPVVVLTRGLFVLLTLLMPLWSRILGLSVAISRDNGTGGILDAWNRWDTLWYDDLAKLGYNLHGPNDYKNVAFFPLYPLLTRTLHDIMAFLVRDVANIIPADPTYPPYLVPALVVANVCSLGALVFFYEFARLDHGRVVARRAVTLLALFPPSLFLAAAYSEGTYLLCAVAFFYALRLERWWQAGFWGLLAAAARAPGAVLAIPFLMAWAEAHPTVAGVLRARVRLAWRALASRFRRRRTSPGWVSTAMLPATAPLALDQRRLASMSRTPRRVAVDIAALRAVTYDHLRAFRRPRDWPEEMRRAIRNVLPVIAIPSGLALFMFFLYRVFGDPLWFSRAQAAWWRTFAPPWETVYFSIALPVSDMVRGTFNSWDPAALHDVFYEIAGLAVTWFAWKRLPRPQGVYLWLLWAILLSSPAMLPEGHTGEPHHDVMMSLPRMLIMFFPLFIYLGLQRRPYPWLVGFFSLALTAYTGVFLTGVWIS